MNATEILIDVARRTRAAADGLHEKLTPELVNAHPGHDNSIAWLLWHAAREIDEQLSHISGHESVWLAGGFAERFDLNVGPHELGYGHTPEQARAISVHDPELLFAHLYAVIDAQLAYLAALEQSELSRVVDDQWDPPVTLAARMISMSIDAAEHIAQATYVAGMSPEVFAPRP